MEFKNGYKLIYQKAKELYASKKSIPMADDAIIDTGLTEEDKKTLKLVYETKDSIIVNFTGLPTAEDKPIVLTADGEPVVGPSGDEPTPIMMVPFEVGQKIIGFYFGNVKNGDINEELESFLLAAPIMDEKETVFVGGADEKTGFGMLMLYHIVDEEIGDLAFVGYSADGSGMPIVLYCTRDVEFEGLQLTRGYQNLTNGCYNCPAFAAEVVSYNIDDTSWNGKFIGAIEYKPGPTPPVTLTKFTIEQAIRGFDFGNVNNGDINSALDSFLLGLPGAMEPTPLITGTGDTLLMATHIVYPQAGIDAGVLYGTDFDHGVEGDIVFFYSTSSFEMEGHSIEKGYQNLTSGKYGYLDPNSYSNVKSIRDDEALWNGIYAGADKYEGPIDDGSDDGSSSSSSSDDGSSSSSSDPSDYEVTVNSVSNATIYGGGRYKPDTEAVVSIEANIDYYFDGEPTATLNGVDLPLSFNNDNGRYYAIFTVMADSYVEFTADIAMEEPEEPEEDYNCTGSWDINGNFSAVSNYGDFDVSGTITVHYDGSNSTESFSRLLIGNIYDHYNNTVEPTANVIQVLDGKNDNVGINYANTSLEITLNITGGADENSYDLYSWLTNNKL